MCVCTVFTREDREWGTAAHNPYKADHPASSGYHSEYHSSGYQSVGPPTSNPGHPINHVNSICLPSGHPENSYLSDGYPIKTFINPISYNTPPRHPEFSYPSSGHPINQHLPSGQSINGPTGPPSSRPQENGFINDVSVLICPQLVWLYSIHYFPYPTPP